MVPKLLEINTGAFVVMVVVEWGHNVLAQIFNLCISLWRRHGETSGSSQIPWKCIKNFVYMCTYVFFYGELYFSSSWQRGLLIYKRLKTTLFHESSPRKIFNNWSLSSLSWYPKLSSHGLLTFDPEFIWTFSRILRCMYFVLQNNKMTHGSF